MDMLDASPVALLSLASVVVVMSRQLLGMTALGTFAPVLLAVAGLGLGPVHAAALGALLLGGVLAQPMLRSLDLPRVARLSVTVCLLAAATVALDLPAGAGLPLVASAAVLERLTDVLERDGVREGSLLAVRTLVIAAGAWWLLRLPAVVELARDRPMALCLSAAVWCLLAGLYRSLRVSELLRFRQTAADGRALTAEGVR